MPSSTSSSEAVPVCFDGHVDVRLLLAALCIAVTLLVGAETTWRQLGFRPSVADTPELWAMSRASVNGDPSVVALLGDSQMQLGFSPDVFRARHPERPVVQLAINGRSPFAVLRDLAEDPDFKGTAIVDLRAEHLDEYNLAFGPEAELAEYHAHWAGAARWPYHDATARVRLRAALQAHWAVLRTDLGVSQLLRRLIEGSGTPEPTYATIRADRSGRGDFEGVDFDRKRRAGTWYVSKRVPPNAMGREFWDRRARDLAGFVRAIEARGGRVIFVRFPTSPERFRAEERVRPRARYWDVVAEIDPVAAIHFRDVPALAGLVPPDGEHLDHEQARAFTEALLDEIDARGAWTRPSMRTPE